MLGRVGDYGQHTRLTSTLLATQARMRADEAAVASGKQTGDFADVAGAARTLLRAEAAQDHRETFIRQNERVVRKLEMMDVSLGGIVTAAERARALLVQHLNGATGSSLNLAAELRMVTEQVVGNLNATHEGAFLFSGSAADRAPVALPPDPVVTDDASLYYQGDTLRASARLGPDLQLEYGVTADEPPFAKLIAGLGSATQANQQSDINKMRAAFQQISTALDGIIERRSEIGTNTAYIKSVTDEHDMHSLYLKEVVSSITDTDLAETMTRIANDKVQIEASYVTMARLNDLSLLKYL